MLLESEMFFLGIAGIFFLSPNNLGRGSSNFVVNQIIHASLCISGAVMTFANFLEFIITTGNFEIIIKSKPSINSFKTSCDDINFQGIKCKTLAISSTCCNDISFLAIKISENFCFIITYFFVWKGIFFGSIIDFFSGTCSCLY